MTQFLKNLQIFTFEALPADAGWVGAREAKALAMWVAWTGLKHLQSRI